MNVGDVYTAHQPDGSEWDRVRVVGLDSANKAVVILPAEGFVAPVAVEAAGFINFYDLTHAAEEPASGRWETRL